MNPICRVCLNVEEEVPFYPLAGEEARELFVESQLIRVDQSEGYLCANCMSECLQWRLFRFQIAEYDNPLNVMIRSSVRGRVPNRCGVCMERVSMYQIRSEEYREAQQNFKACSTTTIWPGDISRRSLCICCIEKCVRWDSLQRQAVESDQKLKKLDKEKLNCRVEITRCDIERIKAEPMEEEEEYELVGYELPENIDGTVKEECPVEKECPVDEECPVKEESVTESDEGGFSDDQDWNDSESTTTSDCGSAKEEYIHKERTHTEEKPFQCKICPKSYLNRSSLIRHTQTHTGEKPFQCLECSKSFSLKQCLTRHQRIHTGENPFEKFQCNECPKSFTQSGHLTLHKRYHTGEKPFQCKDCPKSFADSSNLTKHKRIHTGDKRFQCEYCQKSFTVNSFLVNHKRIHTGEKPFQCTECKKTFPSSSALAAHKKNHTGQKLFKCKECPKSFWKHSNLASHKKTHTGKSP